MPHSSNQAHPGLDPGGARCRIAVHEVSPAGDGVLSRCDVRPRPRHDRDFGRSRVGPGRRNSGLKLVWLAPWGDVAKAPSLAQHHRAPDEGRPVRPRALEQAKNPTRRGVTVWVETDGTVYWAVPETLVRPPWRWRQPQRQRIRRQRPDLPSGDRRHFDRGGVRRQSPTSPGPPPRRGSRRGGSWSRCCARATASTGPRSMRILDRLQGRALCEGCALATLASRPGFWKFDRNMQGRSGRHSRGRSGRPVTRA